MAITDKGKAWELRNSIWMLWAILTFGFFNYISFFYISYRVKQKKWFIAGIIYSLLFILAIVAMDVISSEHWFADLSLGAFLLGWIVSIVHVFRIRTEYLLRLEARFTTGQKDLEIQSLKEQIERENARNIMVNRVVDTPEEIVLEEKNEVKSEESVAVIDINTASEEEIAKVPGIGALFAKKVVEARGKENGFTSFDHFAEVLSIQPHLIGKMKPYLKFPENNQTETDPMKRSEGRIVDF